jgi:prepilin peptidase dependent protein B
MMIRKKQQGFTLVELMVGLVVGLIVIGGSLAMFLSTLQSSNHTLKMSKLNQNLTAVMQLMVNEVRRAGYSPDATISLDFDTASNCFAYSYWDLTAGTPALKKKAFRLVGSVLKIKNDLSSCINFINADDLTDSNAMTISAFTIDITNYRCINVQTELEMSSCSTAGMTTGDKYITIREVYIQITAQSASYATDNIESTLTESVRVRNDLVTTI